MCWVIPDLADGGLGQLLLSGCKASVIVPMQHGSVPARTTSTPKLRRRINRVMVQR